MHEAQGPASPSIPRARSFPWFAYTLLTLLAAATTLAGLALIYRYAGDTDLGTVNQIRISAKPGIDLGKLEEILDTPDYYLEVWTEQGKQRTATFKNTRVGNGLSFTLPVPLRLADVREVKVYDQNVMSDDLVDRIDHPARATDGEKFHFQLAGPSPTQSANRQIGLGLTIAGAAALLLAAVRFIWSHVV